MKKALVAFLSLLSVVGWSTALLASTSFRGAEVALVGPFLPHHHSTVAAQAWGGPAVDALAAVGSAKTLGQRTSQKPQVLGASTYGLDQLSSEEALALDKPGVVEIINRMKGLVTIPDFDIDLKTFDLTPRPDLPAHNTKVNEDLLGSGFVVNPAGYIVTSAHVVSQNDINNLTFDDVNSHWDSVFNYELDQLSDKQFAAYKDFLQQTYGTTDISSDKFNNIINASIDAFVRANSVPNIVQTVVVVDKSQKSTTLDRGQEEDEVFGGGLSASIVGFDKQYEQSGKDAALIKISASNMPALPLGDGNAIISGSKVWVLGYPGNARISNSDFYEPTLTQGVISAVKQYREQKLFQLDTKVAEGSSGGPLTDAQGRVLGLITYLSGDAGFGDQFGYALPVEMVKDLLSQNQVTASLGIYGDNYLQGLSYEHQSVCKNAITSFTAAEQTDSHFSVSDQVAPFIQSCQTLITEGKSKDSPWDVLRIYVQDHRANAVLAGFLAALILAFGIVLAVHFIRKSHPKPDNRPLLPPMPLPPSAIPAAA